MAPNWECSKCLKLKASSRCKESNVVAPKIKQRDCQCPKEFQDTQEPVCSTVTGLWISADACTAYCRGFKSFMPCSQMPNRCGGGQICSTAQPYCPACCPLHWDMQPLQTARPAGVLCCFHSPGLRRLISFVDLPRLFPTGKRWSRPPASRINPSSSRPAAWSAQRSGTPQASSAA